MLILTKAFVTLYIPIFYLIFGIFHSLCICSSPKVKTPIIQIFKIPSGLITTTYTARKEHLHPYSDDWEDYPQQHLRSPFRYDYKTLDDVDDEYGSQSRHSLRDDDDDEDKEFLREKIEISQMMKELKDEDNAEEDEDSPSNGGFASTLFNSFLPFMGSRSMRTDNAGSRSKWASQRKLKSKRVQTVITQKHNQGKRKVHNQPDAVPQVRLKSSFILSKCIISKELRPVNKETAFQARRHHYHIILFNVRLGVI